MARPIRTIDVYANPYSGLDPDGVPQGVTQMPGSHNFIGAARDLVACEQTGKTRFYFTPPNEAKGDKGVHGLRRMTVPFTGEVARAVLEGGLIVADEEHARMVGLSADDFVEAGAQLEAERVRALAERKAQYGADASIGEIPTKLTERPDPTKVAAERAEAAKAAKLAEKRTGHKPLEGTPLAGDKSNPSLALRAPKEV